jgi:hypothetical protein
MAQNDPLKWMPSTQEKATKRFGRLESEPFVHLQAQSAFCLIQGIVVIALNRCSFYVRSLIKLSNIST